jgi:hypothetical protein
MERSRNNEFDKLNLTEQELDRMLESEAGNQVRNFVRSMPEEPVSMAWRSELNQKLSAHIRTQERKRRFAWIVSPALGLGLAGALAFVFVFKGPSIVGSPPVTAVKESKLEEKLVASIEDNLRNYDMTGVGLSPDEVVSRRTTQTTYDIIEAGFDSL